MGLFQKKKETPHHTEIPAAAAKSESVGKNQLYEDLERVLSAGKQGKGVVLKLYIENFKLLNDVFGYDYCEQLLDQIITWLSKATGTKVYRHIGVEFIMILDRKGQGQAEELAEEILERFDQVWNVGKTDCLCSIQIGMCSYASRDLSAQGMMKCLDIAISTAAGRGPNQSVMFDSQLEQQFLRRQAIAMKLKTALANREIEVRYRPTYHMTTQRFTRAEFYMRIFIEGLGLVGATEFIPIAEDSGQIRDVEYFALDQVGACIADLIAAGKEFDSIALPISSVLLFQNDYLEQVQRVIDQYQIPAGKLAIEINASALTTAYLNLSLVMEQLSSMGVELILNDFGTGYASITSILDLPVNTLKLERMFIWQLETNQKSAYIIQGLIQIARKLGVHIIAEGVETENQINYLDQFGCEYEQGFYYAPTVEKDLLMQIMDTSLIVSETILAKEKEKMQGLMKR